MNENDTKKLPKKLPKKYECEKCKYSTRNYNNYKKHLQTNKHINNIKNNADIKKLPTKEKLPNGKNYLCLCGNSYTYQNNLSRHKKNCNYKKEEVKEGGHDPQAPGCAQEINYKELIITLLNQNKELQDLLISQQEEYRKEQQEHKKEMKNLILHIKPNNTINNNNKTINNNNNNKTFNIMMFLNDKCKDAMTIQDFAERLVVTIEDLEKKKFDCLTNTILKNLKSLAITERPVHCGNIKKKEWYLHDKEKGWEMDNGEKHWGSAPVKPLGVRGSRPPKNTEYGINKKYKDEFKRHNPNYLTVESIQDKYMRLINTTLTDLPENEKSRLLNILSKDLTLDNETQ